MDRRGFFGTLAALIASACSAPVLPVPREPRRYYKIRWVINGQPVVSQTITTTLADDAWYLFSDKGVYRNGVRISHDV